MLEESQEELRGEAEKNERRGRTLRVAGVGGNLKMKIGDKIEARATGYSRHVNLSVKCNK